MTAGGAGRALCADGPHVHPPLPASRNGEQPSTAPAERVDGYAPIADYGVLGDGRTVALVAGDGRIDWWPLPVLDALPVCAAILDPERGGHVALAPEDDYEVTRHYLPGTNVLGTTYTTAGGAVRVTTALNTGSAGRLPWTELVHRVDGVTGHVAMRFALVPGDRFGQANPWATLRRGTPFVEIGDQTLAVVCDGTDAPVLDGSSVTVHLTSAPGQRVIIAVVGTDREPVLVPSAALADDRLTRTIEGWRRWTTLLTIPAGWGPAVERSALVLKTLLAESSGAIAAAATTSLPERVGGPKNWDYRYAWVRDSSFTLDALINLGLHEEVHGAVSWLLGTLRRNGPDLRVFYTLGGEPAGGESTLDVPGYLGSRPSRAGNAAAGQIQLGTYGDLFDALFRYCGEGHLIDRTTGSFLADLADHCCDRWRHKDSGIWELERLEHYTISKIGCWVALDRAARLAIDGQLPGNRAPRWKREADAVRNWVHEHCWSMTKRSYTFHAGTDDLDAAVLLAGRTGFDRGSRLATTIEAVVSELGEGPCLYRYSGMREDEGAFVACSFWLVDALVHVGEVERARAVMDGAVALANELGLLAEQIDPRSGTFLGNVPQGLSHLALVNAAFALRHAAP